MLARIQKSMTEKDEGFTLIELLVVIIIIGILAAIAIPVFLNQRKKATEASLKSDLRTVANEMETYYTDFQVYPPTVAGSSTTQATTLGSGTSAVTVKTSKGNVVNGTTTVGAGVVAGTFCLDAVNDGLTATSTYRYDSDKGGLLDKNVACS